jgi:sulfur relay (sulfurtransferase) complex TusBCD TusD component (DsrE family)
MSSQPNRAAEPNTLAAPIPRRLFLRERGWNIGLKTGTEREFCSTAAPGDEFYHRLSAGEVYVHHGDERLCLPCAERRGVVAFEPKMLRQPLALTGVEDLLNPSDFDVAISEVPDPTG